MQHDHLEKFQRLSKKKATSQKFKFSPNQNFQSEYGSNLVDESVIKPIDYGMKPVDINTNSFPNIYGG